MWLSFPSLRQCLQAHCLPHSIAYGVIAGIVSYILLNLIPYLISKASGGLVTPPLYSLKDTWSIPPGGFMPLWMRNLSRGHIRFWEDDSSYDASHSDMSERPLHHTVVMDPAHNYEYQEHHFPPGTKFDSAWPQVWFGDLLYPFI